MHPVPVVVVEMRYDLDDDDDGMHEFVEFVAPSQVPADMDPYGVASPTCIPTTPAG